jgi:hypothetical protein
LKLNKLLKPRDLRPDLVLKEKEYAIEKLYEAESRDLLEGKPAFRVKLLNILNVKKSHPEVYDKYKELSRPEPNNQTVSSIRPRNMFSEDLEIFKQILKQAFDSLSPFIKIIDYKYMRILDYERYSPDYIDKNGENKVKYHIQKQLIYEWTVQQNWKAKTESEFWIPYFSNEQLKFEKIHTVNNPHFNQSKIKILKINFKILQDFYIKQGLA